MRLYWKLTLIAFLPDLVFSALADDANGHGFMRGVIVLDLPHPELWQAADVLISFVVAIVLGAVVWRYPAPERNKGTVI